MPALEYHNTSSTRLHGARQKHQNTLKFNPQRHNPDAAPLPQVVRVATSLCCRRCQLIIRWKMDYGKYPSITTIRKSVRTCVCCRERNVAIPFHHMCQGCAQEAGVCAKCSKTPEESEADAKAALQRAGRAKLDDDEDEESGEDEEEEEEGFDDDDDDEAGEDDEAAARAAAKKEEDRLRQLQDEADFPELARLRGLDVSVLRAKLYEERQASTASALHTQGKLRERERRTALRQIRRGNESAAAVTIATALNGGLPVDEGDDDGNDKDAAVAAAAAAAAAAPAPKKSAPAAKKAAAATSSDEETI